MMRVYLAARFERKSEVDGYAAELESAAWEWLKVISTWHLPSNPVTLGSTFWNADPALLDKATGDIAEIGECDVFVLFTDPHKSTDIRSGGSHFEAGWAYGLGKKLVVVGPRENIFYYLFPSVDLGSDRGVVRELLEQLREML